MTSRESTGSDLASWADFESWKQCGDTGDARVGEWTGSDLMTVADYQMFECAMSSDYSEIQNLLSSHCAS